MIDGLRIFLAYVVPCLLLAGCAGMFMRLASNMSTLNAKIDRSGEGLKSEMALLSRSLETVKADIKPLIESQAVTPTIENSGSSGMDTAIRAKVLKMHRLGRSVDQIAMSLHRPKGEVSMLLKVHAILMQGFERSAEANETLLEQKL